MGTAFDTSEESGYTGSPLSISLSTITVLLSTPIGDFVPTIQLVLGPLDNILVRALNDTKANLRPCNVAVSVELLYQKLTQQSHMPEGDAELLCRVS